MQRMGAQCGHLMRAFMETREGETLEQRGKAPIGKYIHRCDKTMDIGG